MKLNNCHRQPKPATHWPENNQQRQQLWRKRQRLMQHQNILMPVCLYKT